MASRLQDVILRGLAADRPLATEVGPGTLYYSTDTAITERCADDGLTWESYTDSSGTVAAHAATHLSAGVDPVDVKLLAGYPGGATTFLRDDGTFAAPPVGKVVQVVNYQTGAFASGIANIPIDDTIPQNTEGNEYMSLAVTPTNAANKLRIDVVLYVSPNSVVWIITALFQDSIADALAAAPTFGGTTSAVYLCMFTHYMTAGTTSPITFKVRAGTNGGGSGMGINGAGGGRYFGGTMRSSITITEIV